MKTHGGLTPSFPHISFVPPNGGGSSGPKQITSNSDHEWTLDVILWQLWNRYPRYLVSAIVGVLTLFTLVVWMCGRQVCDWRRFLGRVYLREMIGVRKGGIC